MMKNFIVTIMALVIPQITCTGEIMLADRIENYFTVRSELYNDYVFVAYPVNITIGTANYLFVELENNNLYKVECDEFIPVIYAIEKDKYDSEIFSSILDQKGGPVYPYYVEISDILSRDYHYVTDVDCYSFVDESSGIVRKEYRIEVILNGDELSVTSYDVKAFGKTEKEVERLD